MAARAYQRDGKLSGVATGLRDLDRKMGGLQAIRPDHPRRPSRHGQDRARHQHRLQHRQGLARRSAAPTVTSKASTAASSASSRSKCRPSSSPPASSPSRPRFRRTASAAARSNRGEFDRIAEAAREMAAHSALHRRDRRPVDRPARRARAPAQAPARPRPARGRLHPAAAGLSAARPPKAACRKSPRSPPA